MTSICIPMSAPITIAARLVQRRLWINRFRECPSRRGRAACACRRTPSSRCATGIWWASISSPSPNHKRKEIDNESSTSERETKTGKQMKRIKCKTFTGERAGPLGETIRLLKEIEQVKFGEFRARRLGLEALDRD